MSAKLALTVVATEVEVVCTSDIEYVRPKELIPLPELIAKHRGRFAAIPEILPRELKDGTRLSKISTITVKI